MADLQLESGRIVETVQQLLLRIDDRFPGSGLYRIGVRLLEVARETESIVEWIGKTHLWLRGLSIVGIACIVVVALAGLSSVTGVPRFTILEFVQASEASINLLIFLSIAVYFFWTLELKRKRSKVVHAVNRLRDMAHIIDMHQLTKDPSGLAQVSRPTEHSPKRDLSAEELDRYLDYCTEMLSLLSKLGYLYVTKFPDPEATEAVNDLEDLTTGLSRKIWQKIMILHAMKGRT
ncbi:MAG: hypothetical protein HY706_11510 [Candidatus Hydrogenedentes bacterium]|nr:hypothetical protein [Candidatus Hydrogenedentota bacterium]